MATAMDVAKLFIKHDLDKPKNKFDGNMKLQKLLFFADLISISEFDRPLFNDDILAFENGCVVEKVRLRYQNDYLSFCKDSISFDPDFTQEEYDVIKLTEGIFGNVSARELSRLSHTFQCWKESFERSKDENGFKHKERAVISIDARRAEANRMKNIIAAYKRDSAIPYRTEVINGITFSFVPGFQITEDVIENLERFSATAEDDAYTVYEEHGEMVIY